MTKICGHPLTDLAARVEEYEETIEFISGPASLLILPRGGRILGADLGRGNMLWVNPNIEEVLKTGEWNTGGIRTWVSPERAFFYDDPQRFRSWRCPPGIDPAEYKVVAVGKNSVKLTSKIQARNKVLGEELRGTITRDLQLISVRHLRAMKMLRMRIRIHDILNVRDYEPPFALWTLIQVHPGQDGRGIDAIPVVKGANPIHYFDQIPESHLRVMKDKVEFIIDGRKELKLGIRPEDLAKSKEARLNYDFRIDGEHAQISVLSYTGAKRQTECVDPPRSYPNGPRAVIQSYNSETQKSGLCFGELEIQGTKARTRPNGMATAEEEVLIDFILFARDSC